MDNWPELQPGEVQAWTASLDVSPGTLKRYAVALADTELERAHRFRFEHLRRRFIAGRGILRYALARYLDVQPNRITFTYGPLGKPELTGDFASSGIHFNLSHSEEVAFLAVTRNRPLGADVERIRPMQDATELVRRFFSPRECMEFEALAQEHRPRAFFNLWTRKEAWLKATGEGLSGSLRKVEVSFLPGDPPRFLSLPHGKLQPWHLHHLEPLPDFVAAVAITGKATLSLRAWPAEGSFAQGMSW